MKKIFSVLISLILIMNIISVPVLANEPNINYPERDSELGYLFSINTNKNNDINLEEFDGIRVASKVAGIYYAETLDDIKAIEDLVKIEFIEVNSKIETPVIPDEPIVIDNEDAKVSLFGSDAELFGEENTTEYPTNDPLYFTQWYHAACKTEAYRNNGITGEGVKIGIIDSGLYSPVYEKHEDLIDINLVSAVNVCAYIRGDEDRLDDIADYSGHGTTVTSVIAAKANNSIGLAGITDNVNIAFYRIFDPSYDESAFGLIKAVDLAYQDNCDVVNVSWSVVGNDKSLEKAINVLAQNGTIIVAGSGNDGANSDNLNVMSYPAGYEDVIGVGGVTTTLRNSETYYDEENDKWIRGSSPVGVPSHSIFDFETVKNADNSLFVKCDFSTANESVFIAAPASIVWVCTPNGSEKERSYRNESGTSYATPIVAAAAVGVKQMRPYVDVDMFKEILIATSTDLDAEGYDINTGYGLVNFEAIYEYVQEMPETAPEKTPEITVDTENKVLKGFISGDEYTINGNSVVSEDGTIAIDNNWYGSTLEIVKVASADYFTGSEVCEVVVPAIPLTINYDDHTINGFINDVNYTANGTPVSPEDGKLAISDEWYGTTLIISKNGSESNYADAEVSVSIPSIPEAPTTVMGGNNSISGLDNTMEYKNSTSEVWISCDVTDVTGLSAGTYDIRYEYTDNSFASKITQVEVTSYQEATPVIAIDFINETLTGFVGGEEYLINNETVTPEGTVDITEDMLGTTVTIVKKATEDIYTDSEQIEITIPTRTSGPTGMYTTTGVYPTVYNVIAGIPDYEKVEYRYSSTWKDCTASTVTMPPNSTISFRYKATETTFASEITEFTMITPTPEPTATPKPTVEPTEEPTPTPTVEPTVAPTSTPVATVAPTATPVVTVNPTVEPTTMPTTTPTVKPTIAPTAEPTVAPTATPVPTDEPADVLEKEYDVETSVRYSKEKGRIYFECNNKTGEDVKCVSFVAIYDSNGALVYIRMMDTLQAGQWTGTHPYSGDVGRVKFFTWKDMSSMQPMDNVQASELVIE